MSLHGVAVGASGKHGCTNARLIEGRERDDRHVGMATLDLTRRGRAVHARHHVVHHDDVRPQIVDPLYGLEAIAGLSGDVISLDPSRCLSSCRIVDSSSDMSTAATTPPLPLPPAPPSGRRADPRRCAGGHDLS